MRKINFSFFSRPFLLSASVLVSLTGCYSPGPDRVVYHDPHPVTVVENDDYVYYPGAEVYYNNTRREYVYREGRSWVRRPQPPREWARTLPGSASVHVDFHDTPERHHADVVKTYPKNWHPDQPKRPDVANEHHEDHRDDHR